MGEWTEADQARADLIAEIACEISENDDLVALVMDTYDAHRWRPIETAPRDGTEILLFWPQRPPADVGKHWFDDSRHPRALREGFKGRGDNCIPPEQPTHWMPIDSSPDQPKPATE